MWGKSELSKTDIHGVLRNERRRLTIQELQRESGAVELRELAEKIAATETGESPPPRNIKDSVYNSLHQTHLPKLDDLGIIRYDSDRKLVELQRGAREIDLYMEVVNPYGITWSSYYRSLGLIALLIIVFARMQVPLISSVPVVLWATLFFVVIGLSTTYQLWSRRWFYLSQIRSEED